LGVLLLLTVGVGALPFLFSVFFWKFVLPVLVVVGLGVGFFWLILGGDDDPPPPPPT